MSVELGKIFTALAYPAGLMALFTVLALVLLLLRKRRAAGCSIGAALLIFFLASNPLVSSALLKELEQDYPPLTPAEAPRADAVVLLGGGLALYRCRRVKHRN